MKPVKPEVVSEQFLDEAARAANQHHMAAVDAASRIWFEHAVLVGEILIKVQEAVPVGEWGKFVGERLTFKQRAANMYMRIATYKDHLAQDHPPTFTEAVHRLQFMPQRMRPGPLNAEVIEAMRQELKAGKSQRAVAKAYGVDHTTVSYWTDKTAFQRKRNQVRKAQHRLYSGVKEKARAADEDAMRKYGGALNRAYRLTRRAQRELDTIDPDNPTTDVMTAMENLLRAERNMVAAMKRARQT